MVIAPLIVTALEKYKLLHGKITITPLIVILPAGYKVQLLRMAIGLHIAIVPAELLELNSNFV
jgi:hypothetical protein